MSLERIEVTPFAALAGEILQDRKTGTLTLIKSGLRRILYFSQGELVLIVSDSPDESLPDFLVRRGAVPADQIGPINEASPEEVAARFHETGLLDLSTRQTLLRDWLSSVFVPLFSLDEGTAIFTDAEALDPDKRVFLQSTVAVALEGIRAISNGLVLRRSLGDLKREIARSRSSRFNVDAIPLNETERRIAETLAEPQSVEAFLRQFSSDSVTAAKVVISMSCLGVFATCDAKRETPATFDDMQRDLALLAAIGSSDTRSLRAVALSRQLGSMDHYQFLGIARAATRAQIVTAADVTKKKYDPATFPAIVRDSVKTILGRTEEALNVLKDATRRAGYDKILQQSGSGGDNMRQRVSQQAIAEQNYARARELTIMGDYYSAILLLKQSVDYAPDNAQAWFLLGTCQERNPNWRREAAESFQKALSVDPNFIDAMLSLGDVYKAEGMISRAQSCWEDVLKIAADNQQAMSRLATLKKR